MHEQSIQKLKLTDLKPNNWNPNRMSEHIKKKLRNNLKSLGYVTPIVAAQTPNGTVIVDGEHRWKEMLELGKDEADVIVLNGYTDKELKLLTVNLNELKGQADNKALAVLLAELESGLSDFKDIIAFDDQQVNDLRKLIREPLGNVDKLKETLAKEAENAPQLYSFLVDGEPFEFVVMGKMDKAVVENALQKSKGDDKHHRFYNIMKHFAEREVQK